MTDATPGGRESLDHWLTDRHSDFCHGMGEFLDPDAGLREVTTLHDDHTSTLRLLESHLDTQAGLAAILSPPPSAAASQPLPSSEAASQPPQRLLDANAAVAAADPAARLALLGNPIIFAVILSDFTVRALLFADEAPVTRDLARARDLASTRELVRDLDIAVFLARQLEFGLSPELVRARSVARSLARGLSSDLARALAGELIDALTVALRLAQDSDPECVHDVGFVVDLGSARKVAHRTALLVERALGIGPAEGLAAALLNGALDDFTHADLTATDLSGCDLTGMRWSEWGTAWPPGTDIDELRARSRGVGQEPGVYVITNPIPRYVPV